MPSGERNQIWFPEIIALLRRDWRPDASWDELIRLRGRLQAALDELRRTRGIVPQVVHCSRCDTSEPAAPPRISVRAMLISVRRFGLGDVAVVEQLERAWARHRRASRLDRYGRHESSATLPSIVRAT